MIADHCQGKDHCRTSHCLRERTAYIYGLYDEQLYDIFYVGSTFYPAKRFADHLSGALAPYNYKSLWLQNILESGSYPIPLLLYEFQTMCDNYTKQVEHEIAKQVRAEGHTALCDGYGSPSEANAYWDTLPKQDWAEEGLSETDKRNISHARYVLELNLKRKWIERIAEQARVTRMLREMYHY